MNDVGGVRIITDSMTNVHKIKDLIVKAKTSNKLIREYNYIDEPKESGYRSYHLVYEYHASKQEYKRYRIELQIRSKIQHAWATAVEVMGTFAKENLKASEGDQGALDFFKKVSQAFTSLENKEAIEQPLKEEIIQRNKELSLIDKLKVYNHLLKIKTPKTNTELFLLQLDTKEKTISIFSYEENYYDEAYKNYRRIESEIAEDNTKDVVMVFANSMEELKKAYPNYLADTKVFLENLNKVIK